MIIRIISRCTTLKKVDFTEKMIEKARLNTVKLDYSNVEFRQGDIENIPLAGGMGDVVVSNCVLNLVAAAFAI